MPLLVLGPWAPAELPGWEGGRAGEALAARELLGSRKDKRLPLGTCGPSCWIVNLCVASDLHTDGAGPASLPACPLLTSPFSSPAPTPGQAACPWPP